MRPQETEVLNSLLAKQSEELENGVSAETEAQKAEQENRNLKYKLEQMYDIVKGSLVTLDVAVKVGAVGLVFFFPLPPTRYTQAIAMAIYAVLVTIISKGLRALRGIKEE